MIFNNNKTKVIFLIYIYGNILKKDLITILDKHSNNSARYVEKLKESNVIEIDKSSNLISLTKESTKEAKQLTKIKKNNKQITDHNLLAFESMIELVDKIDVSSIDYEHSVINTSLRSDLKITTVSGIELYIEFDNGTETVIEIKNKVVQYELNNYQALFIFRALNDSFRALFANPNIIALELKELSGFKLDQRTAGKEEKTTLQTIDLKLFELIALDH